MSNLYISTPKPYEDVTGWTPCPAPNEDPIVLEVLEELKDGYILVRRVGAGWLPLKVQRKWVEQRWKIKTEEEDDEVDAPNS